MVEEIFKLNSTYALVFKPEMVADTGDTKKKSTRLFSGIIRKIVIDVPIGNFYTAGLRFEFTGVESADEVLPKKENGSESYFMGNDNRIQLTPNIKIIQGDMKIFGANSDVVNNHKFIVTIEIERLGSCQ